jgi:hypothetical protein
MINRMGLWPIALVATSLLSACQPSTPQQTPEQQAAKSASDAAAAANLAALDAAKQAATFVSAEKMTMNKNAFVPGATAHQIQMTPVQAAPIAHLDAAQLMTAHKAAAMHAAEATPAPGLKP